VQPTLFGTFVLRREWGRIGSPGRIMTEEFASEAKAEAALLKMKASKKQRELCRKLGDDGVRRAAYRGG
jgi:predicted DNA-binding WGR domain protein